MSTSSTHTTTPRAPRLPLSLAHYGGRPTWPERPTLGLKALVCPRCGHYGHRLMPGQPVLARCV